MIFPRLVSNNVSFSPPVAGQISTLDIELTNDALLCAELIYLSGATPARPNRAAMEAQIEFIELVINGTPQWRRTPAEIFNREDERGYTVYDGRLPIRFAEPGRRTAIGEYSSALQLRRYNEVLLRVKLAASGVTNPTLDVRLLKTNISQALGQVIGSITTDTVQQVQITGAGLKKETFRPEGRALHFMRLKVGSELESLKVKVGNVEIFDFYDKTVADALLTDAGFTPQADSWLIGGEAFTQMIASAMQINGPINFEFQMSSVPSGGRFEIVYEEFGEIKG